MRNTYDADPMKLHLVDVNAALVSAWRTAFAAWPDVEIQHGDILSS